GQLIARRLTWRGWSTYIQDSGMTVRKSASFFLESAGGLLRSGDALSLFIAAGTIAILARGAWTLITVLRRRAIERPQLVELILAASVTSILVVPIATAWFSETAHWRYLMLLPFLVVDWIVAVLGRAAVSVTRVLVAIAIASSFAFAARGVLAFAPH